MWPRLSLVLGAAILSLLTIACQSDSGAPTTSETTVLDDPPFEITLLTENLVLGPNRVLMALIADDQLVEDASLSLRFFFIDPAANDRKTLKSQVDAVALPAPTAYVVQTSSNAQVAIEAGGAGVYATEVAFDAVGEWVVEVTARFGRGTPASVDHTFRVQQPTSAQ